MTPDFKPSEVRMWRALFPLIGTFGRAEDEFAAALIVIACVHFGDDWKPVTMRQIGEAMHAAGKPGGCLHHLATGPIPRPDHRALAKNGFAEFLGDVDGEGDAPPIQFTTNGFEMLRKTVRTEKP